MKKVFRTLYKKKSLLMLLVMTVLVSVLMFYPPKSGDAKSIGPGDPPVETKKIKLKLGTYVKDFFGNIIQTIDGCPANQTAPSKFSLYNFPQSGQETFGNCNYASMAVRVSSERYYPSAIYVSSAMATAFAGNYIEIDVPKAQDYDISIQLLTKANMCLSGCSAGSFGFYGRAVLEYKPADKIPYTSDEITITWVYSRNHCGNYCDVAYPRMNNSNCL